ncbi:hypothetical protein [Acinetobacter populi]|uniref:Uncharacterized protein n=1 Tax=Acinetobacter populi TaxID=1582270 RepID=A0A1Z9YUS3_9GAMM|nr:hypothetical protein [Acinetobacter populi]OUY05957.1 hypothetical protein CAP51_14690 [Acinetobacter populi]
MPNLTFYIAEDQFNQFIDLNDITQNCCTLCIDILGAELNKVHIHYIPVKAGCGYPVYAELIYRLSNHRSVEIMENFMQKLNETILQKTGLVTRIRCFGFNSTQLHAYN